MTNYDSELIEIIVETTENGEKGEVVRAETLRILNRLTGMHIQLFQEECNTVAQYFREQWRSRNQASMMLDPSLPNGGLNSTSYEDGIDEISPPFLLNPPISIHVYILTSVSSFNPARAAETYPTYPNPSLKIFLPSLNITNLKIKWNNYVDSFESIIVHEFLHLYGDIQKDGVIRHNWMPANALSNLGIDLTN